MCSSHTQPCGYGHPPTSATCERCHYPIYRMNGSWFSCPMHMGGTCYTGRFPTGADLGVRHKPAPDPGLPAGRTATAEETE